MDVLLVNHFFVIQDVPDELVQMAERYEAMRERKDRERDFGGGREGRGRGRGGGRGGSRKFQNDFF